MITMIGLAGTILVMIMKNSLNQLNNNLEDVLSEIFIVIVINRKLYCYIYIY
jgi:hypothetical protein